MEINDKQVLCKQFNVMQIFRYSIFKNKMVNMENILIKMDKKD